MSNCGVVDCKHNNLRETCCFFKLPEEPKLRAKWLRLIKRDPNNIPKVLRVCSCHFRDGKKENGPQIFSHNKGKLFQPHHLSPEVKTRRKKLKHSYVLEDQPSHSTDDDHMYFEDDPFPEDEPMPEDDPIPEDVTLPSTSKSFSEQHTSTHLSRTVLEVENYFLNKSLETKNISEKFGYSYIKNNQKLIVLYTGLPDSKVFNVLYNLICDLEINYYFKYKVEKISKEDQLLMTLMKLRQNFPHEDLAFRFGVSIGTVSNIIITWIHILYEILYKKMMSTIPSRQKNKSCLPTAFNNFTNCRIVLDCTEVYTHVPRKSMKNQKLTFSSYKHRNTLKALVGGAPNGVITFVSDLYPGSVSDKQIVSKSGIINHLEAGDLVLADKGFLIRDILPPEIHLNLPPFLVTPQFSKEQIQVTESIARARIHVERAIRRLKCYKILNLVPSTLRQHVDVIFKTIAALTNLKYPLIKEVETLYNLE